MDDIGRRAARQRGVRTSRRARPDPNPTLDVDFLGGPAQQRDVQGSRPRPRDVAPEFDQVTGRGSPHVPVLTADVAGSIVPPPGPADVPPAIGDRSGHANTATWSGGVTFGAPGLASGAGDMALGFDGSSGFVQGPVLAPLSGGAARSVEVWLQTTATGQQGVLDASATGGLGQWFQLGLTQNEARAATPR